MNENTANNSQSEELQDTEEVERLTLNELELLVVIYSFLIRQLTTNPACVSKAHEAVQVHGIYEHLVETVPSLVTELSKKELMFDILRCWDIAIATSVEFLEVIVSGLKGQMQAMVTSGSPA